MKKTIIISTGGTGGHVLPALNLYSHLKSDFDISLYTDARGVKYIPKELFDKWEKKDPIKIFEKILRNKKILNEKKKNKILKIIEGYIVPNIDKALNKKKPVSNEIEELKDVYKKSDLIKEKPTLNKNTTLRFVDAIKEAMYQKLLNDDKTLIMGQDIAEYGGVFKITEKFVNKFGKERVRNTPITESAVVGTAMGLAIEGYKPIVEMQFADFVSVGFNQIVKNEIPIYEIISGAALAFAALLLIIPGFLTDIIGFLLIIPITRKIFIRSISSKFKKKRENNNFTEGEFEEIKHEEDDKN